MTTTLQAIGVKSGMADSIVTSAVYTIGNLAVTAPNGGERWCQGAKRAVTWTPTGDVGPNVKIELFKGRRAGQRHRAFVRVQRQCLYLDDSHHADARNELPRENHLA